MPDPSQLPDLATLAAPFYLVLIAWEFARIRRGNSRGAYAGADTGTSLSLGAGSVAVNATLGALVWGIVIWAYTMRVVTIPTTWQAVVVCFVLGDFVYYWQHRLGHRSRWLWASHGVHHSSRHYNLATALRQSWSSPITGLVVLKVPLALLGFHPGAIAFVASLNLVYQFWIHTEAIDRLPRGFEFVFNTPSHHRVHHGSNPRYLDANYAGTLIVWDRMFGTFVPEQAAEPVRYGLVHDLETANPFRVAFQEYGAIARDVSRPALSLLERFAYVVAPPGWSHDGSRQTSSQLKAGYVARHPEGAGAPGLAGTQAPNSIRSSQPARV